MTGLKKRNQPISFDELLIELKSLKANEGEIRQTSLETLFNEAFMSECSSYNKFEEFLAKGNYQAKTLEDIDNIPREFLDRHVARETTFINWQSMLDKAKADCGAQ